VSKSLLVLLPFLVTTYVASANDYPTVERVDHVLTCMRLAGGQTIDNLFSCSCEIDAIAEVIDFDDFNEARTYESNRRMPGEKGGLFRNSKRGDEVVGKLLSAREGARKRCFIRGARNFEGGN
tara:strand:- start:1179 stop:1547 length:369 start_codon:yes stop_codon:yes gene_type:complete